MTKQPGVFDKIIRYMHLSAGWHFGEGVSIPAKVARKARDFAVYGIFQSLNADVFPIEDGSLVVEFYAGDESLAVAIRPSLSLDLTLEKGIGPEYTTVYEVTNVPDIEVRRCIYGLAAKWNLHAFSFPYITPSASVAFRVTGSRTLPMEAESPSSISPVRGAKQQMQECVNISDDTILA